MSSSFDPYREWLGIERPRQAANRYTILGLIPFEGDLQQIVAAADAAMAHVTRVAHPEQSEIRDRVLAELQAAKRCLLDPAAREKYNAKLLHHLRASGAAAAQLPRAIPIARPVKPRATSSTDAGSDAPHPPALSASLWDDADEIPDTLASAQKHSAWRTSLAIALGFLLAATVLGLGGLAVWRMQPGEDVAASLQPNALRQDAAQQDVARSDDASPDDRSAGQQEPANPPGQPPAAGAAHVDMETSRGAAVSNAAAADPDDNAQPLKADAVATPPDRTPTELSSPIEFTRALNRARGALAARDIRLARQQLARARQFAERSDDHELVNRIDLIAGHLARFLAAVRAGLDKLAVADELNVGGEIVSVVEIGPDTLRLRVAGARRDYTLITLPAPLALILAKSVSDRSAAAVMLYLGAFQAVEPGGDRAQARQFWEAAAAAGESVDDLMLLLDADDLVIHREPIPGSDVRKEADRRVAQKFAISIRSARSAEQKAILVRKLMTAAAAANDSADQYALLSEACTRAALAVDTAHALGAVDEMARWFEVDPLVLKTEALGKARSAARDPEAARRVALAALTLLDETQPPDELAKSLVLTAVGAARRARDAELLEKASARRREIDRAARKSNRPTSNE